MHHITWPCIDDRWCIYIYMIHDLPSMHVMSYDTSPIIDTWSCHMIHHLPSMHGRFMIHHLPSMHGHFILYITYHRCMVMSCDTSLTIDALSYLWCVTFYRWMVMSYDVSHIIDAWSCLMMHHLQSCHMIQYLLSMHGHVIWHIFFHMIHHLSLMHDHVMWYITYHRWWIHI